MNSIFVILQEIYKVDWMFKLVGKEHFQVGHSKAKCTITIDAVSGFAYEYTLEVNGKSLNKFRENQSKVQKAWVLTIAGNPIRVCLGENMFLQLRRGCFFLSAEVAFTFNKLLCDVRKQISLFSWHLIKPLDISVWLS